MNNQNKVGAPFLKASEIKTKADAFRKKYWGDSIPVDIERIIEFKMGLEIRPVPGLSQRSDAEAGISSNWKVLIVDRDIYEDERRYSRLRFSLAHEIGHLVLHKDLFGSLGISSMADYYQFTQEKAENGNTFHDYVEMQAGMFANMLLVPREELLKRKEAILKKNEKELANMKIEVELLESFLAKPLAREFDVSEDVMVRALSHLDRDLRN